MKTQGIVRCIRSYSECTKTTKDIFGKIVATGFIQEFQVGGLYEIVSICKDGYGILNEKGKVTKFGKEFANFFEFA